MIVGTISFHEDRLCDPCKRRDYTPHYYICHAYRKYTIQKRTDNITHHWIEIVHTGNVYVSLTLWSCLGMMDNAVTSSGITWE